MTTTLYERGLHSMARQRAEGLPLYIRRLQTFQFGPYKSGKTVAAHQMPNTRTLDFDDGMQSVEWAVRTGILDKFTWEMPFATILPEKTKDLSILDRALAQINLWIEEEDIPSDQWEEYCRDDLKLAHPYPQLWDTLIVDTMTGFNKGAINQSMYEMGKMGQSKSWDQWIAKPGQLSVRPSKIQDYGGASNLTEQFIEELRKLPKNLVVNAHEYIETDDEGNITGVKPLLWGQSRNNVPALFDEVWYVHTRGPRTEPEFVLQTTPDSIRKCGSRLGCLDPIQKMDFPAIKSKVAQFYEVPEDLLWLTAHGTAAVAEETEKALAEMKGGKTI